MTLTSSSTACSTSPVGACVTTGVGELLSSSEANFSGEKAVFTACVITAEMVISELILKEFVITWLKQKPPFKTRSFGSLRNRVHIRIYTAWICRRDPPLQGLNCCLVKHFNISGSEIVGSCIKSTGSSRCRVPRGEGVAEVTVGVGIAVNCSVVGYVQVFSRTKGWSVTGTCVNSVIVMTWLDVHLNRNEAIDVI